MALPRESVHDDELVRHLLGALSEDEAQRVEESAIVDDELAARLQRVEDDLVDAYARGTLEGDRLARFESFYLASPRRRERVEFAKRFLTTIDDGRVAAVPEPALAGTRESGWSPWLLAAAAALFLATGMLLVRDVRLREEVTQVRQRLSAAEQQAAAVSGQLAEQQRAAAAPREPLADVREAPAPRAALVALVLLPQTRGAGPVSAVAIPSGTRTLPLYLKMDVAAAPRYSVALRDPVTNRIVWRSAPLTPERTRAVPVVAVHLPAAMLKAQHYTLEMFEVGAGTSEFAGSYAFEVVRQ